MIEIINWIVENWGRNITAGSIAALVLILFDKFVKDLVLNQLRKMFHLEDGIERYAARQIRIEQKVDLLLERNGIAWNATIGNERPPISAAKQRRLSHWLLERCTTALNAEKFTKWRNKPMNINRAILVPLLSAIALFVKESTGYEVSQDYIDTASNIILFVIMLVGIFMKPHKEKEPVDPFLQIDSKE